MNKLRERYYGEGNARMTRNGSVRCQATLGYHGTRLQCRLIVGHTGCHAADIPGTQRGRQWRES